MKNIGLTVLFSIIFCGIISAQNPYNIKGSGNGKKTESSKETPANSSERWIEKKIQTQDHTINDNTDEVVKMVEQMPEFPGGQSALMSWLSKNITYPARAQENNVEGRVVVRFVVEKDGSISDLTVVKGVDIDLDQEAMRVVKKMPRWKAGRNNGVAVRSYMTLPVTFKLQH